MSESSLQMLLHAGEVAYIFGTIKTIRAQKLRNAKLYVGGCLFGLWRNSLKQPVIQFVTGPGKKFNERTSIERMFESEYTKYCREEIGNSHRLLHLGFWFCGTEREKKAAIEYVFMDKHKYNVLLFINVSNETLTGEYIIQTDNAEANSQLYKEDVLPGHSSFRLFGPLTDEIKKDAIELPESTDDSLRKISDLIDNLPSRVQVEEAVTHDEQWYSSDEGMVHLQLIMQYFSAAGIQAGMSRDAVTHNIQFDLSGGYSLDFPYNFPKGMPSLRSPNGRQFKCLQKSNDEKDVCKFVVGMVLAQIQSLQEQQGRRGIGGDRGR